MQLERLSVLLADILYFCEAVQVVEEVQHFLIGFVVVEWDDGDSVADLVGEAEDRVVDDHDLGEVLVENAQVFDIVALGREHAVLAVQSLLEQLLLRIHVVEDGICVDLMARREQDDLVVLARLDEALDDKRPDIDSSVHRLLARKVDFYYDISLSLFNVIDAMNQSFIHVENRQLFLIGMLGLR